MSLSRHLDAADSKNYRGDASARRVYGTPSLNQMARRFLSWSRISKGAYFIDIGFFEGTFINGTNAIIQTIANAVLLVRVEAKFSAKTIKGENGFLFPYLTGGYSIQSADLILAPESNLPSEEIEFESEFERRVQNVQIASTDSEGEFPSTQGGIVQHLEFGTNFNI